MPSTPSSRSCLSVLLALLLLLPALLPFSARAAAPNTSPVIGSEVVFGAYPQTAEGTDATPITWLVLDKTEDQVLLISRDGLDAQPYHADYAQTTWENCTLRAWLNNDFLHTAFTTREQQAIALTHVSNAPNQGFRAWATVGGRDTEDFIFLLSYAEARAYLGVAHDDQPNLHACVHPTDYAQAQGAATDSFYETADGTAAGWWWLRSPGFSQAFAAYVFSDGTLSYTLVQDGSGTVRPALWVKLDAGIF